MIRYWNEVSDHPVDFNSWDTPEDMARKSKEWAKKQAENKKGK